MVKFIARRYASLRVLGVAAVGLVTLAGSVAGAAEPVAAGGLVKATVSWVGLTCEAPIFAAQENGYFREEGLDVEMVKVDWNTLKEGLSFGRVDATHTLVMYMLKPMEQGMDARITAGVHTGCLRIQTSVGSPIKSVQDLKGKRIGVPLMGSPPFIFASRVLGANGIDARRGVEWKVFPAPELGLALDKGEVDAIANADPIGTLLLDQRKVRNIVDQATDAPYKDEYCCAVVVSGKCYKEDPAKAAKLTRAILKGAKWVQVNPAAAAAMAVERKYLPTKVELNAKALSVLNYSPSVAGGASAVTLAATEMKAAGMLNASTDIEQLAERAFGKLNGVNDDWVQALEVDKVVGGDAVDVDTVALAKLVQAEGGKASCCSVK